MFTFVDLNWREREGRGGGGGGGGRKRMEEEIGPTLSVGCCYLCVCGY